MLNIFLLDFVLLSYLSFFSVSLAHAAAWPQSLQAENLLTGQMLEVAKPIPDKKALVVIFLSAKCPCSNSHVVEVQKLANEYPDFRFLAIHSNADELKENAKNYFQQKALSFPVVADENSQIADILRANKTPHSFVISKDGQILYQGGVTNSADAARADRHFLKEALEEIHQGKKVSVAEGRTLGCAIIRKDD